MRRLYPETTVTPYIEPDTPLGEKPDTAKSRPSRPSPAERLDNPASFLSRTDLRELGLERRAVDAVFRALPIVSLEGYSRPLIRVADYRELMERSTYRGERVRPV